MDLFVILFRLSLKKADNQDQVRKRRRE